MIVASFFLDQSPADVANAGTGCNLALERFQSVTDLA